MLATLLVAGCGGNGGGEKASSSLDAALRYLPADTPFAVSIDTDVKGEQYAKEQLEDLVGDLRRFEKALGNEFVVGSTNARSFLDTLSGEDPSFVGAIQAADRETLDGLLQAQDAEEVGDFSGATLYEDDSGDPFAIEEEVLIVAGSKQQLETALETRDGNDNLTEEDFDAGTEGVPADALLRVYLDVEGLLRSSPDFRQARRSRWVRAVRTAAVGLSPLEEEVTIDFKLHTRSASLNETGIPLAPGAESPKVLDIPGVVNIALRNPEHVFEFAKVEGKAIDPAQYVALFRDGKNAFQARTGVFVDEDIAKQMDGDLAVSVGPDGRVGMRAELNEPELFEATLARLEESMPDVAEDIAGEKVRVITPKAGETFYTIAMPNRDRVVFGVADGSLVLANDAATAAAVARARTKPVPGAEGALVVSADAERLSRLVLPRLKGFGFGGIGKRFDRLTGSVESSTEGLSGSFRLTLD